MSHPKRTGGSPCASPDIGRGMLASWRSIRRSDPSRAARRMNTRSNVGLHPRGCPIGRSRAPRRRQAVQRLRAQPRPARLARGCRRVWLRCLASAARAVVDPGSPGNSLPRPGSTALPPRCRADRASGPPRHQRDAAARSRAAFREPRPPNKLVSAGRRWLTNYPQDRRNRRRGNPAVVRTAGYSRHASRSPRPRPAPAALSPRSCGPPGKVMRQIARCRHGIRRSLCHRARARWPVPARESPRIPERRPTPSSRRVHWAARRCARLPSPEYRTARAKASFNSSKRRSASGNAGTPKTLLRRLRNRNASTQQIGGSSVVFCLACAARRSHDRVAP